MRAQITKTREVVTMQTMFLNDEEPNRPCDGSGVFHSIGAIAEPKHEDKTVKVRN